MRPALAGNYADITAVFINHSITRAYVAAEFENLSFFLSLLCSLSFLILPIYDTILSLLLFFYRRYYIHSLMEINSLVTSYLRRHFAEDSGAGEVSKNARDRSLSLSFFPDKSRRLANKVARGNTFDRNQIYWRRRVPQFFADYERLRLPYGDKRGARPKESSEVRIAK